MRFYLFLCAVGAIFAGSTQSNAQSDSIASEIAHCDDFYADIDADRYADIAASLEPDGKNTAVAYELAYKQKGRRECLERARDAVRSQPALVKQYDAVIAANDKMFVDRFAAARAEFETNVVKYLAPADYFGEPDVAQYKAAIASARKVPTFKSMCKSFDFGYVPMETNAVNAARARHEAFKQCYDRFSNVATKMYVNEFLGFQTAGARLAGLRQFTCSQWARPNCIPDAEWKRFGGELFTSKNRLLVDAANKKLDAERKLASETDRKVSDWVRELSARIRQHNGY